MKEIQSPEAISPTVRPPCADSRAVTVTPEEFPKCSAWRCRGWSRFWSWVVSAAWPPPPPSVYSASNTPKMLASSSWPPSALVWMVPVQPFAEVTGWPWLSWPRTKVTSTFEQSIAASSGSVTRTLNGMASPKLNSCPSLGSSRVTFGAVLPTTTCTLALPVRPLGSFAVSVAV